MAISQATAASHALVGGTGGLPSEDGVEAAAIWAVATVVTDSTSTFFRIKADGDIRVGVENIPGDSTHTLASYWDAQTSTWDGLSLRAIT